MFFVKHLTLFKCASLGAFMSAHFVCVGVGGGAQGRCGGGGGSLERKEGEGSRAEHNNCSCVHNGEQ